MEQDNTEENQEETGDSDSQTSLNASEWAPAGFWLRFFAIIYDSFFAWVIAIICMIPVFFLVILIFGMFVGGTLSLDSDLIQSKLETLEILAIISLVVVIIALLLMSALFYLLYFVLLEKSRFMTTPGKAIFGLIVTDLEGNRVSFWAATKRNLLKSLGPFITVVGFILGMALIIEGQARFIGFLLIGLSSIAGFLVYVIGHLMAAFTVDKQALHDSYARCLVLKRLDVSFARRLIFAILAIALAVSGELVSSRSSTTGQNKLMGSLLSTLDSPKSPEVRTPTKGKQVPEGSRVITPLAEPESIGEDTRLQPDPTPVEQARSDLPPRFPSLDDPLPDSLTRRIPQLMERSRAIPIQPANIRNSSARLAGENTTFQDAYGRLMSGGTRIEIALLNRQASSLERERLARAIRYSNMREEDYQSLGIKLVFAIQLKANSTGCSINDIEYYELYYPTIGTALQNRIRQRHVVLRRGVSPDRERVLNFFSCERRLNGAFQLRSGGRFTVSADDQQIPLAWEINTALRLYQ